MTWIKLNDNTTRHPKVAGLSDKSFRIWIDSLCYASEFLTDGVLPVAFLINVKQSLRDELVIAGLWDVNDDASVSIHDYLEHQTSRDSVEQERKRNRDRRRCARGTTSGRTAGTTDGTPAVNPRPEAEAEVHTEVHTENREQQQNGRAAPLVMSPLAYERRKQQCAYVGARLEVPHGLHGDLRKLLGGATAETDLLGWYEDLDAEIEVSGEAIAPDVFRWLKARYTTWAKSSGERSVDQIVASVEALRAARKAARS